MEPWSPWEPSGTERADASAERGHSGFADVDRQIVATWVVSLAVTRPAEYGVFPVEIQAYPD